MAKELIGNEILTFTIPYIPMIDVEGRNQTVNPNSDIVAKTEAYFRKHFKNHKDFRLDVIENDRWVYFEDTDEWTNLGNSIIYKRIRPIQPTKYREDK